MSTTLEVVRHDITDEYLWPSDVFELFRQFSQPLPKLLASDAFQTVLPLRTLEMLAEALKSPALVLEDRKGDREGARPVTDVVDTILSSVWKVRAASAFGRGEGQARSSWTSLITMLGITISKNVYIAYGRIFLFSYTFDALFTGKTLRS